ncbi:MAG: DUF1697 domain-containing protein [Hyphomonas sp.]|nr:DUF1697 domain-containing protein [Hyphomonas sp.]
MPDAASNRFVALLRAVNVGGTGKLPMAELKAMCEALGYAGVKTYIASGNVVFRTAEPEALVQAALEARLEAYAGKPVGVHVRSAAELSAILAGNPFPEAAPNRTLVMFLDRKADADLAGAVTGRTLEDVRPGKRELYIHYPDGQADSKLKLPKGVGATGRNINTVTKLAELTSAL